jgi:predicted O-methyltransferase YrrM
MFNKEALEEIVKRHPDSFPAKKFLENFHLYEGLYNAIGGQWINGCGSYMMDGQTYDYNPRCLKKQEDLYRYSMNAKNVLEVGVYVGHSLLIMLLANPNMRITAIDIDNRFTQPAIDYLNRVFGYRITFIHADAINGLQSLPYDTFDLVHIDADHNDNAVYKQFMASMPLAKDKALFIFDDYDAVKSTIDGFVTDGILEYIKTPDCLWRNTITRLVARNKSDGTIRICQKFSACSHERLSLNIEAVEQILREQIPGDIVEIGVYKGGSMLAMMRTFSVEQSTSRKFWLYDTFEGMTAPCEHDKDLNGYDANELMRRNESVKCISGLDEVRSNIETKSYVPKKNINYVVGDICKTDVFPEKIAVLRLDTDFYESTKFELENFYDLVSPGGYIIIDDYGHWQGCKKAVDEFFTSRLPSITPIKIDYTGIYWRKPQG